MVSLRHFKRDLEDLERLREISTAFASGGFAYYIKRIGLNGCVSLKCRLKCMIKREHKCPEEFHSLPIFFRKILEELGPTFVKLGQLLSLRPDVIPLEYADELRKLQDKVPAFSFEEVKKIIKDDLNTPLTKIFSSFEEKPIAAGSIAQVHIAKLRTGKKVAVKIMRPNISEIIKQDIRIMEMVAELLENKFEEFRKFRLRRFVQEFKEWTLKEIDFRNEANSMAEMKEVFKDNKLIIIPYTYVKLSSKRVLTMEFVEGIHVDDKEKLDKFHINRKQLAINAVQVIIEQTLVKGVFHGDPHPGNIFVSPRGGFSFIDFGIVGRLSERQRKKLSLYMIYLYERDFERALRNIIDLAEISEESDIEGFKRGALDILSSSYGSLETNSLSKSLFKSIILGVSHGVYFPSDLVLLSKAFVTIESVGRNIYPEFSMLNDAKEPVERILKKQLSPIKSAANLFKNFMDYNDLIEELPIHVSKTLKIIEDGKLTLKFDDKFFKPYMKELHETHTVKVMGMIIASLILASGITSFLQEGPKHMLALSMIQIYLAGGLFIWLIRYMRKNKKI